MDGDSAALYINYSKVPGTDSSTLWKVADSDLVVDMEIYPVNISIPESCWNYSDEILQLALFVNKDIGAEFNWSCYNGTGWNVIRSATSADDWVSEEGIFWHFANTTLISPINSSFKDSSSSSYLFNWTQDVYYQDQTNYRLEIWNKSNNFLTYNRTINTYGLMSYWPLEYVNASDLRGSNDGTLSGFNLEHYHASDTHKGSYGCLHDFESRTDKTGNCTLGGGAGSIFLQPTGGVNDGAFLNLTNVAERNYTGMRITPDTGFVYAMWLKNTDLNAGRDILSTNGHAAGRIYQYNNDVLFAIDNSTGQYRTICTWDDINDAAYKGVWTHIAVMYNTTNNTITCYHEGEYMDSVVLDSLYNTDQTTYLGSQYDVSARAGVDAFRISDNAVPEKIIKAWAYVGENYTQGYNCDDSIRNGDETGIDMGGSCIVQEGHDGNSTTSLQFDGVDDYIEYPIPILSNPNSSTVCIWAYVEPSNLVGTHHLLFRGYGHNGGSRSGSFRFDEGKIEYYIRQNPDYNLEVETEASVGWHHFCGTYVNNVTYSQTILTVDGVKYNLSGPGNPSHTDVLVTQVGSRGLLTPFNGTIDEMLVFEPAIDHKQIKAIYENQSYKYNCSDGSPGALSTSTCGGTCDDSCTHTEVSIKDFIINADNEWRICVLNDTKVEYCTVQNEFYYNFIPVIGNIGFYLRDLLSGNQHYNITFNVTDGTEPITCNITTQSGTFDLTWNNQERTCTGNFSIPQSNANVFSLNVNDGINESSNTGHEGVEIEFNKYQTDPTKQSTLSTQYFLQQYNLTNSPEHPIQQYAVES